MRRGYHHGNLREALIATALELIGAKGPAGFTFAEAARAAGVSPAAPYRHFRDRDELVAAVAHKGYVRFEQVLAQAWNGGRPDALRALHATGKAYLSFARMQPAYYAAMFESGTCPSPGSELDVAAERAFAVIRQAAEAVVATLPAAGRPPVMMVALHLWSQAHGIASLFGRADGAGRSIPMEPGDLLEAATLIYLRGLAADTGRAKT